MADHILGIQQIFGGDIGNTENRPELKIERMLSLFVNKRCSLLAQAFIHPYVVKDGRPPWQTHLGTFIKSKVYSTNLAPAASYPTPHLETRKGRFSSSTALIDDTMFVPLDFFDAQEIQSPLHAQTFEDPTHYLRWTGSSFLL